ncbi:MAG: hypothetical protein M1539_03460 [Actinobacteria bacterium]|nr:hypothetical protein [Actinomycetota bacterium]MCL5883015.1 hypothetical protein [Actinomycetota bacterium]
MLLAIPSGCGSPARGDDAAVEPSQTAAVTVSTFSDADLAKEVTQKKLEELAAKALVVKVIQSPPGPDLPPYQQTWSQDGKGSFRLDSVSDVDIAHGPPYKETQSQVIFNASQGKAWLVFNDIAYEETSQDNGLSSDKLFGGMFFTERINPFSIPAMTSFMPDGGSNFSFSTQTDETGRLVAWEFHWTIAEPQGLPMGMSALPGQARTRGEMNTRVEFNGPEGLPSKVIWNHGEQTPQTFEYRDQTTETFEYLQLSEVPESLFELPASVKGVRSYSEFLKAWLHY